MVGAQHRYLVALGSNQRHPLLGPPRAVLGAALATLEDQGWRMEAASPVEASRPVGPSKRLYANGAALVSGPWEPPAALARFQYVEELFGRRRRGSRWRARVLDLDIVLWSGGAWVSPGLVVPHPRFRDRRFVLGPAAAIAPRWRDPMTGLTLRALDARLTRRAPLPR